MNEPRKSCIVTATKSDSSSSVGNLCRRAARLTQNLPCQDPRRPSGQGSIRPGKSIKFCPPSGGFSLVDLSLGSAQSAPKSSNCWVEERVVEQGKHQQLFSPKTGGNCTTGTIPSGKHFTSAISYWIEQFDCTMGVMYTSYTMLYPHL